MNSLHIPMRLNTIYVFYLFKEGYNIKKDSKILNSKLMRVDVQRPGGVRQLSEFKLKKYESYGRISVRAMFSIVLVILFFIYIVLFSVIYFLSDKVLFFTLLSINEF